MKFALGTVQFGIDYGVQGGKKPSEEMVDEMLSLALDKKIYHFDTASSYGNAEELLGRYIEKNSGKALKMNFISKLNPSALADIPQKRWKDVILSNVYDSIKKLNVSELEAFLFHNAKYLFYENAVHAMECVCREKMAKKIGVSIYSPQEAMKALEYDEIKVIQIPYNVFDQRLDKCGFFELARKRGVEVYARSSLLQGLLMLDPNSLPENMRFAEGYIKRFLSICKGYNVSPLKVAVGYVGEHPDIDYVVFGVDNKAQMLEYLSMQKEHLTEDMVKTLQKEFENVEEKLVNPVLWND